MVKLHIIDLIGSLRLEALLNDIQLLLSHLHTEVVEDGAESGEGDEAASALILILEVWLDQQTTVLNIGAKALEHGYEDTLLLVVQHVLRVENRGCVESSRQRCRVLLDSLVCEDVVKLITEGNIVDEPGVVGRGEVVLQALEFCRCEKDALAVENTTEFLRGQVTLSECIKVLEEL